MLQPKPVTLTGQLVRLEPLSLAHIPALLEIGLDPAIHAHSLAPMATSADLEAYVDAALAEQARGLALPFAQVSLADGRVVGSTRYGNIDVANGKLEIGWTWLGRQWQRSGINTEAKLLLLTHAFETLGCRRVELKSDANNAQSRAAMERIGAVYEGTLRRHLTRANGTQRDSAYYSFIAEDWPDARARLRSLLRPAPAIDPGGGA